MMKLSFQCGRADSAGRHNDRNFDVSLAEHINPEKSADNRYWTYNGETDKTFRDIELDFYKSSFKEYIKTQNKKNRQSRHLERNKSINQYYSQKYTRPEDVIIQIGNTKEHVSPEQLWACTQEYISKFNERFGDHCVILDAALHVDEESIDTFDKKIEGTPHVHLRRVWVTRDEDGVAHVSQTKALCDMGYPAESQTGQKTHNNKISFTKAERSMFADICKEHDINLDLTPGERARHLTVKEYKAKQDLIKATEKLVSFAENTPGFELILTDKRYSDVENADPGVKEQVLNDLINERIDQLGQCQSLDELLQEIQNSRAEAEEVYRKKYEKMKSFLKEKHHDVYKEYASREKTKSNETL